MKRPLVLVVDDEPAITMTSAAILQMHGYRTAVAADGEMALAMACELHPDLILSDVVMPRMNGVELAIAVGRLLPESKVLLISGNTATADIMEAARATGYEFKLLAKPVPMDELLSAIFDCIGPGASTGAAAA